jgi:hypothetical protein
MSDAAISEETNTATLEGDSNAGTQEVSSKEIWDAEVKALTEGEGDRAKATEFNRIPDEDGRTQEPASTEETIDEATLEDQAEATEEEESPVEEGKKQRKDWKKEAIESQTALKSMEEKLAAIEAKLSARDEPQEKPKAKPEVEIPDIPSLDESQLSQEVKDLLEYTPGLDTMIKSLAAEQVKAILEKVETDRAEKSQQAEQSKASAEQDSQYWSSMESWITGQYPELTLSEIRNSPDFNDWLEYRKSWVDTQLNGVDRYDVSGAQKVFDRYIRENDIAQPREEEKEEPNHRRMAAARSPSAGKRTSAPATGDRDLWQDEVRKLTSAPNAKRYI